MEIEVRMAIFSHLSDAQELNRMGMTERANEEINYAKRIMNKYRYDITQYVEEAELTEACLNPTIEDASDA